MTKVFLFLMVAILASLFLYVIASSAPYLDSTNLPEGTPAPRLKLPQNFDDISGLVEILSLYKQYCLAYVLLLFCSAYIYNQCFAIPGSVFMNLISGALFGVAFGFPLVCLLTSLGATGCYLLSKHFGKRFIEKYFSQKVDYLQRRVEENMDGLFFFLLFLRILPLSPNWFINLASPIVNIPIPIFFFSALIGLMPYNFVCVQAGSLLTEIRSTNDIFTWSILMKLVFMAVIALLPGFLIKRFRPASHSTCKRYLNDHLA